MCEPPTFHFGALAMADRESYRSPLNSKPVESTVTRSVSPQTTIHVPAHDRVARVGEPLVAGPVGVGGHDPEHARPGRRGADGGSFGLAVGQLRSACERLLAQPAVGCGLQQPEDAPDQVLAVAGARVVSADLSVAAPKSFNHAAFIVIASSCPRSLARSKACSVAVIRSPSSAASPRGPQ